MDRSLCYTNKQLQVINGEIDPCNVDGRLAYPLLNKARALQDNEVIVLAERLLAEAHERAKQNNLERVRKRQADSKAGTVTWKRPKSNEYTDHQIKVIQNEIPLEKTSTKELIHIHLKAKNLGDIELSERILNIIIDRRIATEEKRKNRIRIFREANENIHNIGYEHRKRLTEWERAVLSCDVDLEECTLDHLRHILKVCQSTHDADRAVIAALLLQYKEHPETVYVTQDPEIAIRMIENMLGRPIRRPSEWFAKS